MKKILIDTNVYAHFKRKNSDSIEIIRKAEYIGISVIVLGEILSGFKGGNKENENIEELNQFLASSRVNVLPIDEEITSFYAKIYWDLKKIGKPIPTNDIWIGATAMKYGITLYTYDEHFKYVTGILLQNVNI